MTPNTCPPEWLLSDMLMARKNEHLLQQAHQAFERAKREGNLQLAVAAEVMFKLHAEAEANRLAVLAVNLELHGELAPDEWERPP